MTVVMSERQWSGNLGDESPVWVPLPTDAGATVPRGWQRTADGRYWQATAYKPSGAALLFIEQVAMAGLPLPTPEVLIVPGRKLRVDLAWIAEGLLVEIDGAIWKGTQGGHTSGKGYMDSCEKQAYAILLGWRILRFPTDWVRVQDGRALGYLTRALERTV